MNNTLPARLMEVWWRVTGDREGRSPSIPQQPGAPAAPPRAIQRPHSAQGNLSQDLKV